MYRYSYDLHLHTCLSPCGDNDMTPNNIVNMAALKNLDIIAVSDHNSTRNCRAVINAARNSGLPLLVIPAVEITTSEDIHVLVYFKDADCAERFEREIIDIKRIPVKNEPSIFGEQIIMNEYDEEVGREEILLINAINLSIDEILDTAKKYEAVAVPAHIDKEANGMLAIMGTYTDYIDFSAVEIKDKNKIPLLDSMYKFREKGMKIISDSDAHYLWDILEVDSSKKTFYNYDNIIEYKKEIIFSSDFLLYLSG